MVGFVPHHQPTTCTLAYDTLLKWSWRNMSSSLEALQPLSVWAHFATLCDIPRPSKHEAALREHLIEWAQARGITAVVDNVGNLILKKPASPGCESMPGVIMQGHLDMVCQA